MGTPGGLNSKNFPATAKALIQISKKENPVELLGLGSQKI